MSAEWGKLSTAQLRCLRLCAKADVAGVLGRTARTYNVLKRKGLVRRWDLRTGPLFETLKPGALVCITARGRKVAMLAGLP